MRGGGEVVRLLRFYVITFLCYYINYMLIRNHGLIMNYDMITNYICILNYKLIIKYNVIMNYKFFSIIHDL